MSGEALALVGETVLPDGFLRRAAMVIEGGGISEVREDPRRGFVELRINGFFSLDVDADPETLKAPARELPRTGITSFCRR